MNALYSLAFSDFTTYLFVFMRIGIIFAIVPFFSSEMIPRRITAMIVILLSAVILPVVPRYALAVGDINAATLFLTAVHELLLAVGIGMAVTIIFTSIQLAGELIGFQMGFAIVNVVDPMTGTDAPVTSNLLYIIAVLLFLSMDFHHVFLKAIADSFTLVPISTSFPQMDFFNAVLQYASVIFLVAVKFAAPVIGVLILINAAFGLITRAMPQMNIFILSFPINITLGMIFMVLIIKYMPLFLQGPFERSMDFIHAVMRLY